MPPKLIVYVVHGMGLNNPVRTAAFCGALLRQAELEARRRGRDFALTDLLIGYAEWSAVHQAEAAQWLRNNYPHYDPETAARRPRRSWGTRLLAFLILMQMLFALLCLLVHRALPEAASLQRLGLLALAAVLVPLLLLGLAVWLAKCLRLPWGDLWHAARGFEAESLADLIVYQSATGRQAITGCVLDGLKGLLRQAGVQLGQGASGIPVLLIGHSLGSVVCYDLLCGVSAAASGGSRAQRELAALRAQTAALKAPTEEQAGRLSLLSDVVALQQELRPVGFVSMGSPISLFAFRKPALAGRADMWREALPPEFAGNSPGSSALRPGLRWRWLNFWHSSDFVAHRLERMFNQDWPAGKFVEDVRSTAASAGPIGAHASYWNDRAVLERIGTLVAELLA